MRSLPLYGGTFARSYSVSNFGLSGSPDLRASGKSCRTLFAALGLKSLQAENTILTQIIPYSTYKNQDVCSCTITPCINPIYSPAGFFLQCSFAFTGRRRFCGYHRGVPSDGLRRYGLSILKTYVIREIRDPNAFKTRVKCTCHEIALSDTRQACTWNCPVSAFSVGR